MFGKKKKNDEISTIDNVQDNVAEETHTALSWKEMKALKKNDYGKQSEKYDKAYVIKNKRTGMIVELRAASPVHAANLIGWRPRHVSLIKTKDIKDEVAAMKRIDDANSEIEKSMDNCPALK